KVLGLGRPEKVVLVMPPVGEEEARGRWEKYCDLSADRLPPYQGGELVLGFDPRGTCQVVRVAKQWGEHERDESAYREAIRVPGRSRFGIVLALCVLLGLWGLDLAKLLIPGVQKVRESAAREQSRDNLQQLTRA